MQKKLCKHDRVCTIFFISGVICESHSKRTSEAHLSSEVELLSVRLSAGRNHFIWPGGQAMSHPETGMSLYVLYEKKC